MASNSSSSPPPPAAAAGGSGRYFCHRCIREVENINQDSFTCPFCNQGFLEELHENEGGAHVEPDDDTIRNEGTVDMNQFLRNMAPLLFGGAGGPQQASGSSAAGPNQQQQQQQTGGNQQQQQQGQFMGGPFQGFIQNLLEGLAGGGGAFQVQVQFNDGEGAGGPHQQQHFFGFPLPLHGNPGDYAWGPGGLDAVVTQLLNQFEGGAAPLSAQQIQSIPKVDISQEHLDKRLQCTVCMDDFKLEENVRRLSCGHHFHDDCIVPWLNRHNTCPVCRKAAVNVDAAAPSGGNPGPGPGGAPGGQGQQQPQSWDQIEELD